MRIRYETPDEAAAIEALTQAAFAPMAFADGNEGRIVGALRESGDLTLSLVAEDAGEMIGHAAFSPVRINEAGGDWYGLGPISVRKSHQRKGIGSALVSCGLFWLKEVGAAGCALTGNPAVYGPMGFRSGGLRYPGTEERFVQWILIGASTPPRGELSFAPAFDTL